MKTLRPQKRSVSPFGSILSEDDEFGSLRTAFGEVFAPPEGKIPTELRTLQDAGFIPAIFEKLFDAPANDAPQLDDLCRYLIRFRGLLEDKALDGLVDHGMQKLFERKTELFMIVRQAESPQVLFSKERDALVGRYFAPVTDQQPGKFSEFVSAWIDSENPDRILHFLDFCAGSKNPTFEHYLLFTHPALHRVISNKTQLRSLFERAAGPISKLPFPSWETDVRKALGV